MTALPPELRDHLALALVAGLGPRLTRAVLDHFGSPAAVLKATAAQLEAVPLIVASHPALLQLWRVYDGHHEVIEFLKLSSDREVRHAA